MIALGILGLIKGDFAPIWDSVPKGLPAREALAYLCALISLASGRQYLWRGIYSYEAKYIDEHGSA
jgi:hypothetical protein